MRRPIGYYWTAPQSQIYPELARLTAQGLIEHEADVGPGPRQRKTHRLTDAGRAALAEWLVRPPAPRRPRDEAVLKTYAQLAADPAQMREFYLAEARRHEEQLADYQRQFASLEGTGADHPDHPQFGAYATLRLALVGTPARIEWFRWLADEMGRRTASSAARGEASAGQRPT
jgi:DNA-binding PadR family transcriptional regulator